MVAPLTISTNIPVHFSGSAPSTATQNTARWSDLPDELEDLEPFLIEVEGSKIKTWEELNSRLEELQRSISLDDCTMSPEQVTELHRKLQDLETASLAASLAVSRATSPDLSRSPCESHALFGDVDETRSYSPEDYGTEYYLPGLTTDEEDSGLDSDADNEFINLGKDRVQCLEHGWEFTKSTIPDNSE
ncbi:hypothetical protein DXG03_009601 [Asterophora parasitica]|uniref:Uncharacterized protein n=1 Tax=Asterophora parasitica TaxID=117018 RepID=A0A9P7G4Q3_9AGAR|nr:hypothetical protein DXG03_009601 [Asterophora parasitica]